MSKNDPESWCPFCQKWHDAPEVLELQSKNAALLAEVREWMCEQCNTVYPGPPQQGLACVLCPRCGGNTAPRLTVEKTKLESRLDKIKSLIWEPMRPGEHMSWGTPEKHAQEIFDEIRALLDGAVERQKPICVCGDPECPKDFTSWSE